MAAGIEFFGQSPVPDDGFGVARGVIRYVGQPWLVLQWSQLNRRFGSGGRRGLEPRDEIACL
jgi:hypothetical protein